jgi:hypothetical protein
MDEQIGTVPIFGIWRYQTDFAQNWLTGNPG